MGKYINSKYGPQSAGGGGGGNGATAGVPFASDALIVNDGVIVDVYNPQEDPTGPGALLSLGIAPADFIISYPTQGFTGPITGWTVCLAGTIPGTDSIWVAPDDLTTDTFNLDFGGSVPCDFVGGPIPVEIYYTEEDITGPATPLPLVGPLGNSLLTVTDNYALCPVAPPP